MRTRDLACSWSAEICDASIQGGIPSRELDGMSPREIAIAPASRVVVAIAVIAGSLVSTNALAMIILWVGLILPAMQRSGILGRHLRFVGSILLPMGFLLVTVWGGIVGGAPGMFPVLVRERGYCLDVW